MELKKWHWITMVIGAAIIIASLFFTKAKFFFFMIGMGILLTAAPLVFAVVRDANIANEKEDMFLEFSRNLVESVKAGTPISKSIINVREKPYGVLSEHIKKLANQISLGVPLNQAMQIFSEDVSNKTISRALTLIGQAERSGGEIGGILESVTEAVSTTDKLKKERKAAISSLVVEGYIIFFVFIVIILVLQFQILPMVVGVIPVGESIGISGISNVGAPVDLSAVSNAFLYLLLIQGLFTGFVVGKLSEGSIKPGIKHSFILMLSAFIISTGASLFFG